MMERLALEQFKTWKDKGRRMILRIAQTMETAITEPAI